MNNSSKKEQSMSNTTPTAVNDASNVPSRRRRRADNTLETLPKESQANSDPQTQQAEPTKARRSNRSANKLTPRQKHDSNELAQLQQLSLAHSSAESNQGEVSKPAPLFVIEHENVVPPLKKQLVEPAQKPQAAKPDANSKASASKAKVRPDDKRDLKPTATEQNSKPVAMKEKAARTTASVAKTQVAQTPKLVSTNNEPIPHQRRRRQPSIVESAVTANDSVINSSAASYEKKVPKAAQQVDTDSKVKLKADAKTSTAKPARARKSPSSAKSAQASADKKVNASNKTANSINDKGAVPSKRRRRQPSTDVAVIDQEGK